MPDKVGIDEIKKAEGNNAILFNMSKVKEDFRCRVAVQIEQFLYLKATRKC